MNYRVLSQFNVGTTRKSVFCMKSANLVAVTGNRRRLNGGNLKFA